MECNKPIRNIRYVIFRESNFECLAKSSEIVFYMNGELFIKLKSFFFRFRTHFFTFSADFSKRNAALF